MKLSDDTKGFIVKELAMFRGHAEVARAVWERYGIEITRFQVRDYDPEGSKGDNVARRWKALHAATRRMFLKEVAAIGISHRAYRLRELDAAARQAKRVGNIPLMASF